MGAILKTTREKNVTSTTPQLFILTCLKLDSVMGTKPTVASTISTDLDKSFIVYTYRVVSEITQKKTVASNKNEILLYTL